MSLFTALFSTLFSYDPNSIPAEKRQQVAAILTARSDMLRAMADVNDLRVQGWSGVAGASDLAEIKAQDLAKLRQNWIDLVRPFLAESVDLDKLVGLVPMIVGGALQSFEVPLPVVMETLGFDLDNLKLASNNLKKILDEL